MRFGHGELHLMLLALLSQRPMHGYELMAELEARLGPRYRASPGSIYPALQALEAEGLIAATDDGERRVYDLTGEGAHAFTKRADRIARMETRLGIKIAGGLDLLLARFTQRMWAVAQNVDEGRIEMVLEKAAADLESMTQGEEGSS
jgi:DNA-binding PadR family transcriptional regulator